MFTCTAPTGQATQHRPQQLGSAQTWPQLLVAHAHPARDGAATPLHGSQITAATQARGVFNITATTATIFIVVTFRINPATAAIDTVTTVAVATTRATPPQPRPCRAPSAWLHPHHLTAPLTGPCQATLLQLQPYFTTFSVITLTSELLLLTLQGRTSPLLDT